MPRGVEAGSWWPLSGVNFSPWGKRSRWTGQESNRSPLVTDPDSDRGRGGISRGPGGLKPPTPADQREKESAPAA